MWLQIFCVHLRCWRACDLIMRLHEEFGISVSDDTVYRALKELGFSHVSARRALFNKIWSVINKDADTSVAWQTAQPDDNARWLQESLNDLGRRTSSFGRRALWASNQRRGYMVSESCRPKG
jgi:hypothetical protein